MGQIDNQLMKTVCGIIFVYVNCWIRKAACLTDLVFKQVTEDIPYRVSGWIVGRRHAEMIS